MVKSYWLPIIPYLIGLQNTKHRKPCFCLHVFTINKTSGLPGSRNASLSFVLYVIYSLKSLGTWISNGFKPHFPVKNGPKWKHFFGQEEIIELTGKELKLRVDVQLGGSYGWFRKMLGTCENDGEKLENLVKLITVSIEMPFICWGIKKSFIHTLVYIYTYVNAPIQLYSSGVSMALRLVQQAQLTRSILKGHLIHSWHDKDMKIE